MLVALTREVGRNEELRRWVGSRAPVCEIPLTSTHYRAPEDVASDIDALSGFGRFASFAVTSVRVGRYVGVATPALMPGADFFSVGTRTTAMLRDLGFAVAYESEGTSLDLARHIIHGPVLILGAVNGRDELVTSLRRSELETHLVECYETVPAALDEAAIGQLGHADVVFIGAPSAWRVARDLIKPDAWVLVPGATTLHDVRATHERVLVGWGGDFESAWRRVVDSEL